MTAAQQHRRRRLLEVVQARLECELAAAQRRLRPTDPTRRRLRVVAELLRDLDRNLNRDLDLDRKDSV